jgi:hypothetical protein
MNAPRISEANPIDDDSDVRIFVGAHKHEQLALKVLEYSIVRHTDLAVAVRTVDNSLAPMPADPRYAPYTRFSYGRFAIPKLVGYRGRAIYMDSDMLVFRDIAEVWNTPFDGAKVLIEQQTDRSRKRGRSTAFMMMDCAALRWDPEEIIAGLGVKYDYEQLMSIDPLLAAGDLRDGLPLGWNSLDRVNDDTRLLHFTRVRTQPWVYPLHPLGPLWTAEVKRMLEDGALTAAEVRAEVDCGHVRPSLLVEIGEDETRYAGDLTPKGLQALDRSAGFVPHRELRASIERREAARAERERELDPKGYEWKARWRRWGKFWRHPVRNLLNPL